MYCKICFYKTSWEVEGLSIWTAWLLLSMCSVAMYGAFLKQASRAIKIATHQVMKKAANNTEHVMIMASVSMMSSSLYKAKSWGYSFWQCNGHEKREERRLTRLIWKWSKSSLEKEYWWQMMHVFSRLKVWFHKVWLRSTISQ